jgi:hypothetical protein
MTIGLETLLKQGFSSKKTSIISDCLRTYSAIERTQEAESLFRKVKYKQTIKQK